MTSHFKEASMSGLILQFAFTYTDDTTDLSLNNFGDDGIIQLSEQAKYGG